MNVLSVQRRAPSRIAIALICFGSALALAQERTSLSATAPITFERQILPILEARCAKCHGGTSPQAGLDTQTRSGLLHGGTTGPAIVSGSAEKSLLYQRVRSGQMPFGGPPLSEVELKTIREWIEHGAPGRESAEPIAVATPARHWAYVKPVRPALPMVKHAAWCRNPIDYFVLARLEQKGIAPSPEADKETLIRRLSLDLTGLPPTIAEADAFLADRSPHAYEAVVDRLLASPHYGERWARPWLDMARYGDSNGFENDAPRVAWKFRDWVIQALNQDMSFKQFTIEQIAGDMLPNATTEQQIASGFHRNTLLNLEGGTDPEEQQWLSSVDRVNTTATVWLGTTLQCAQCHNHKFDPFTQKDYYRFLAFFSSASYDIRNGGKARFGSMSLISCFQLPNRRWSGRNWRPGSPGCKRCWTVKHRNSMPPKRYGKPK